MRNSRLRPLARTREFDSFRTELLAIYRRFGLAKQVEPHDFPENADHDAPTRQRDLTMPSLLFDENYQADLIGHANYDVAPDGQRFLMIQLADTGDHLNVILNWFEELERLVLTDE